jgi:methyl-accepting chemotaxis protein
MKKFAFIVALSLLLIPGACAKEGADQYPNGAENWIAGATPPPGFWMLVAGLNQGAEGDLSARINTTSRDEVGQTSSAFNIFMEELQSVMQQVVTTAEHVASASEEISASATQSANGSEAQKDQVHQVATAMQEMAATVHEVSENCNKAAESAHETAQTARRGGTIVEDTLAHMRSIAGSVRETAQKVQELGSRSDQIGKIVGVIDDIADQTNLLALNAAIEAARAGEQGRGFAVVADEVRKLAERTTKATKEIAEMIQSVQADTRGAVDKMQSGTQQVEKGVEVTAKAGESLKQIIGQAEHVGEMVTHIATAANEQSSTTETVNANMDQINKLVAESAEGAQQSAQACEQLSSLALELQNLVSRFKLGQKTSGGYRSPRQAAADPSRVRTALALAPRPPVQHDAYSAGHDRNGD